MNLELLQKVDRIHPYPAKFTVDLAIEYLLKYTQEGDVVFDPFVGSGTTLLAASALHRKGIGTDINHIAILISKAKLLRLSRREFDDLERFADTFEAEYREGCAKVQPYRYPSIEHWFCENSIAVLSFLLELKKTLSTEQERIFAELAMSAIINTVSNQEGDTRYAAIEKPDLTVEKVAVTFLRKYRSLLLLMRELSGEDRRVEDCKAYLLDSRRCGAVVGHGGVDLILTSPPYVNTYDYYLYHKHRMYWLGYDVKYSMEAEIGSRREFSSLKHGEGKFSDDLFSVFEACDKTLKPNGKIVLVIGDGKVAGRIYDAKENVSGLCSKLGWKMIDYSCSNLDDTSRSFQKSYRTKGKKEHIMVFDREARA